MKFVRDPRRLHWLAGAGAAGVLVLGVAVLFRAGDDTSDTVRVVTPSRSTESAVAAPVNPVPSRVPSPSAPVVAPQLSATPTPSLSPTLPPQQSPSSVAPSAARSGKSPSTAGSPGTLRRATPSPGATGDTRAPVPVEPRARLVWDRFGTDVTTSGSLPGGLTIVTPEGNYASLRGVSVGPRFCDGSVDLDVRLRAPEKESPGYGFAVGVRGSVVNGQPTGWTLQLEQFPELTRLVHRQVYLPAQANAQTDAFFNALTTDAWHHVRAEVAGTTVTMTLDGVPLANSPFTVTGADCGEVLLRVWGTTVDVRGVVVTWSR